MRGLIPELDSPQPLGSMLPGLYQGDDLAQRFTSGLDTVLAPILSTLDNLPAYFDPRTAPEDFLTFLSEWVGIYLQPGSLHRRREVVRGAVDIHRWRATARGIRDTVTLVLDAPVEVIDSGGSVWSQLPGAALPGRAEPEMVVRIDLPELSELEMRRLDALIGLIKPAHVPHRVELGPAHADTGATAEGPYPGSGTTEPASATGDMHAGSPEQETK